MIVISVIHLIGSTPMLRLNRLSAGLDVEILAKLEMFNPYSLKDRPALHMIQEAERAGRLAPGGTIVEASSGNTGTALTYIGRQKGYHIVIFPGPGPPPRECRQDHCYHLCRRRPRVSER